MPLDDEDRKEVTKLVNDALKPLGEKLAKRVGEDMAKVLEETVGAKLAEAAKAQATAAQKPDEIAEERKTVKQRIEALEKERDEARAQAKREKLNTAFRGEWAKAKFVPDLADEHMAFLAGADRLLHDDEGTIRVRDPKRAKDETQPTLSEYMGELAKSDRGKLYAPARTTPGQGATPPNGAPGKREPIPNAINALLTGQTSE